MSARVAPPRRLVIQVGPLTVAVNCRRLGSRLSPSEAAALAFQIAPLLQAEAKRRKRRHGGTAPGRRSTNSERFPRTRDLLGAYCGYSGKTLEKLLYVVEAAERDPDRFGGIVRRMDDTGNIDAAYHEALFPSTVALLAGASW